MKMYLPFGDWSSDGHGRYEKVLIDAPSMAHLYDAQQAIKEKYGKYFFNHMAESYEEPYFGEDVWQALLDANYPVERMQKYEDSNDWSGFKTLKECLEADSNPTVSIEFVIDAFIWLLNRHGAFITRLDAKEEIPMICNWTCNGFKTVGYGCFLL